MCAAVARVVIRPQPCVAIRLVTCRPEQFRMNLRGLRLCGNSEWTGQLAKLIDSTARRTSVVGHSDKDAVLVGVREADHEATRANMREPPSRQPWQADGRILTTSSSIKQLQQIGKRLRRGNGRGMWPIGHGVTASSNLDGGMLIREEHHGRHAPTLFSHPRSYGRRSHCLDTAG